MLRVADQSSRTDTGRQRSANEDSYFVNGPLFVVADGMGGAQAGEVASKAAAELACRQASSLDVVVARSFPHMRIVPIGSGIYAAEANAQAIQKIGTAIQTTGGMEAVNLKIAEQYVGAFGNIAKTGNTLIVPGNLSDMSSMIASALTIVRGEGGGVIKKS